MRKVGLIGLGIMGTPMARNLLKAGVELLVNDVVPEAVERLCKEGAQAATREEMGRSCDVVCMMLPNGAISRDVIAGEDGLARYMAGGGLVIDFSSVTPGDSRFCAQALQKVGVGFLDAPVSGGEEGAVQGTLAIMVGGSEEDFSRAKFCFDILGSKVTRIGEVGSGSIAKLVNQVIVNLNIAALSEGLVLAKQAGVDPERVVEAIRTGLAGSQVLEDKAKRMIHGEFVPGGKLSINHKDIKNVLASAHEFDVPMPMTAMLFEIMQSLKAHGHFQEDHSAIVRYFEQLAGIDSLS